MSSVRKEDNKQDVLLKWLNTTTRTLLILFEATSWSPWNLYWILVTDGKQKEDKAGTDAHLGPEVLDRQGRQGKGGHCGHQL